MSKLYFIICYAIYNIILLTSYYNMPNIRIKEIISKHLCMISPYVILSVKNE
ncbi:hypothetical protein EVA_22289 [gut metagenome]|uniref:Uncharacterized protein n=1 Tax=gut metagenome TaxID=749906 RepID=J9FQH7_9ZZZZ